MKPSFALNLSLDGVSLLRRQKGGWRLIGEVALDDADLALNLSYLRRTATDLSGGQFACKLVIPNAQILYRKIDALGATDARRTAAIRTALEGATPYAVEDLEFDWCDAGSGWANVAVVARDTLAEAEAFATEHRFNPVSFVALPDAGQFDGEPYFGQSRLAETLLPEGDLVERDRELIVILGQVGPASAAAEDGFEANENSAPDAAAAGDLVVDASRDATVQVNKKSAGSAVKDTEEALSFSSQRTGSLSSGARPVSRLNTVEARIDFKPDAARLGDLPPGKPTKARRKAEISPMPVTDPAIAGDDRPKPRKKAVTRAATGAVKSAPAPEAQKTGAAPLAKFSAQRAHEAPAKSRVKSPVKVPRDISAEARAMTIFGARRKHADAGRSKYFGLRLTFGVAILVLLGALVSGYFVGAPVTSANFWRSLTESPELAGPDPGNSAPVLSTDAVLSPEVITTEVVPPEIASSESVEAKIDATEPVLAKVIPPEVDSTQILLTAPLVEVKTASFTNPEILDSDPRFLTPEEAAEAGPALDGLAPLTLEEARVMYATSGVWPYAPLPPVDLDSDRVDNLYIASIDRQVKVVDAIAMPGAGLAASDTRLAPMMSPPPPGTRFDLDARGFVRARADGAFTPDGVLVFLGTPSVAPVLRPGTSDDANAEAIAPGRLAEVRPIARPDNLVELDERARFGGLSRAELAAVRPIARPASAQDRDAGADATPTVYAVLRSSSPAARPGNFAQIVKQARAAQAASAAPDAVVVASAAAKRAVTAPAIPTQASVAQAATVVNAISLSRINLIGVYGSQSDRRALVRLKSGRYVKVEVGDRLDGGQVAAIGPDALIYVKNGRTLTLELPRG